MSNVEEYLLVALVGATINMLLSATVPALINKTRNPVLQDTKKIFRANRNAILTSSLIIGVTIFLSLMIVNSVNTGDELNDMNLFVSDTFEMPTKTCGKFGNLAKASRNVNVDELLYRQGMLQ